MGGARRGGRQLGRRGGSRHPWLLRWRRSRVCWRAASVSFTARRQKESPGITTHHASESSGPSALRLPRPGRHEQLRTSGSPSLRKSRFSCANSLTIATSSEKFPMIPENGQLFGFPLVFCGHPSSGALIHIFFSPKQSILLSDPSVWFRCMGITMDHPLRTSAARRLP